MSLCMQVLCDGLCVVSDHCFDPPGASTYFYVCMSCATVRLHSVLKDLKKIKDLKDSRNIYVRIVCICSNLFFCPSAVQVYCICCNGTIWAALVTKPASLLLWVSLSGITVWLCPCLGVTSTQYQTVWETFQMFHGLANPSLLYAQTAICYGLIEDKFSSRGRFCLVFIVQFFRWLRYIYISEYL